MKKLFVGIVALGLVMTLGGSTALAKSGYKKDSIKDKFFKKIKMMYVYQDEIGLSDEQMDKIKAIKIDLKKDLIMKKAQIQVIMVDVKAALYEDEINVEAVSALVDKKYEIKKAKMKKLIQAYADVKKILTQDQMDNLKKICMDQKKLKMKSDK